jgi:hypothetical protein
MATWLGLPPIFTAVWERDSAFIDPLGRPRATSDSSAFIDPLG